MCKHRCNHQGGLPPQFKPVASVWSANSGKGGAHRSTPEAVTRFATKATDALLDAALVAVSRAIDEGEFDESPKLKGLAVKAQMILTREISKRGLQALFTVKERAHG